MIGFTGLLRRICGRGKKKRGLLGPSKFLLLFLCIPVVIMFVLVLSFFLFDDFMLIFLMSFQHQNVADNADTSVSYNWNSWDSDPSVGGGDLVTGGTGLTNMYINKMSGGYYKEMLEIVRDHSDWSAMNSNVSVVTRTGEAIYPQLQQILGIMLSEGGIDTTSSTRYAPVTVLDGDSYNAADGKHSLATYTSTVAAADGGSTLSRGYNGNLDLYYGGKYDKRTNFQFDTDYAAIYPSGRAVSEARFWPSTMNGYGTDIGDVRTRADTDAAYFPDLVSIVLQRSWCSLGSGSSLFSLGAMTETAVDTAMYLPYNYGETGFAYAWGVGISSSKENKPFTLGGWSDKNTVSFAENTANSVNYFDGIIESAMQKLADGWDSYTDGLWDGSNYPYWYGNHSDYMGFGTMSLLLNGCFVDPANVYRIESSTNDGGFIRGATVAYRLWLNDPDASTTDVIRWFRDELPVQEIDTDIYGDWFPTRDNTTLLHYLDEDNKVYRDDGSGPYAPLRSYGDGLRGPWITRLGGVILYWKMLQASGVECTFEEAYQDSLGTLVAITPDNGGSASSGNDGSAAAVAEQMARCMAAYSWPTKAQGMHNKGTELYQSVHKIVLPGDPYFMSCDRGVATAVRWSGADDWQFPAGSTRNQIHYLEGSSYYDGYSTYNYDGDLHWERIYWNGNTALLKPGDILIYSTAERGTRPPSGNTVGHIIMWCGKDIIAEFHGEAANGAVICHASYDNRSPTCGGMYDDAYYFECYRLYNPSPSKGYTQAAAYP